jgi:hypothetical protein
MLRLFSRSPAVPQLQQQRLNLLNRKFSKRMATLHLQVCAGFANRVRALVSGICLAEDLQLPLIVHWFPKSPECACRFSAVLDPESLPKAVKVNPEDTYMSKEILSREAWDTHASSWDGKSDLYIKSYGIFYTNSNWNDHLRRLKPSPLVRQILERRTATVDWPNAIGVHIRRTDNQKSIEGSPLEGFLQKLRDQNDAFFVIATDDVEVREALALEFAGRCVFPAFVLSRRTEEGMIHGVADFFALTKCSELWGSVASSYTEIAARYGNLAVKLITQDDA